MGKIKFSIITPCFNSSKTLERTYSSLLNLSAGDFEWILVDDCSSDDGKTRLLMESIAASAPFPVKLKFLEQNHFSSRSTYEACLIAEGDFACILDHDDQLTPDALLVVSKYIDMFGGESIAGVAGRCVDQNGQLIGKEFKEDFFVGKEGDLRFKKRMTFETFQFTRLEILKTHFSQLRPGYTNGFAWAKISINYSYIFVSDVLRIYDVGLPTSYSNTKKFLVAYPEAKAEALQKTLEYYNDYLFLNPGYSLRIAASSIRHRLNARKKISIDIPKRRASRLFYFLGVPIACIKHLMDKTAS